MFLTVAEFSKRAGIDKKRVYKDWETKLKDYTAVKGGTKMIDEEAIKIYRSTEEASAQTKGPEKEEVNTREEAHKERQENISTNEGPDKKDDYNVIIEELRNIIRDKEAEINDLKEQAKEAQKRIDAKDEQIREDTKRFTETIQGQIILIGQQQERIKLLEAPEAEKKGFFKRLFSKKKEDSL